MQQHPSTNARPHYTRRLLAQLLLIIVSVSVTLAQQPGIDASSVDRLREHISYLASDKLAGRRTGSPGASLAAEYIASEFARYGLRRSVGVDRPGMSRLEADSSRRYMQEFPYVAAVQLGQNNVLESGRNSFASRSSRSISLRVGDDWMPLGFSSNGQVASAPLVFVGYGITAAELKYDDYQAVNVKNKIAFALSGTPDGDNPHGQFSRYQDPRWKAIAAKTAGARALVILSREENFKEDRLAHLRYDNAGEAGLPVIVISRQAAAQFLQVPVGELSAIKSSTKDEAPRSPETSPNNMPQPYVILPEPPFAETSLATLSIEVIRRRVPAANVIGILPGSDPRLKDETIVIGAHYDHLGHGGAGSLAPREGEIHYGADDNASGVAGMLELARVFSAQQPRPKRTIVFMAFSGEEEGLLGSNFYVNNPLLPLANTVAMINMDMIGRLKNNNLVVGGVGTAQEWRAMLDAGNQMQGLTINDRASSRDAHTALPTGVPLVVGSNGRTVVSSDPAKGFTLTLNEDGYGPSDHSSFYAKQIPVLFFWTGTHADYHKPSDTAEKINYEGEARILELVTRLVRETAESEKRLTFTMAKTESTGRSAGFRVYLGTIPNYADSNDGLKLDGVRDDSPAATAGLKAGDRIVKMAGREVKNVYDYTYALGEMKAGQEYQVEVIRGSERLSLRITPAARK